MPEKKEHMLANSGRTAWVKASKLREIVIYPDREDIIRGGRTGNKHTEVKGWFNKDEFFDFGWFEHPEEARQFVLALNEQIEEG